MFFSCHLAAPKLIFNHWCRLASNQSGFFGPAEPSFSKVARFQLTNLLKTAIAMEISWEVFGDFQRFSDFHCSGRIRSGRSKSQRQSSLSIWKIKGKFSATSLRGV